MPPQHIVIVGGGIAGVTAAETLRKLSNSVQITLINGEQAPLYNRTLLPNIIKGHISDKSIFLRTDRWGENIGVRVYNNIRVTQLNRDKKTIYLDNDTRIKYDSLILAIGGRSRNILGAKSDHRGVFTLKTYGDTANIRNHLENAVNFVVYGGSFVGIDLLSVAHSKKLAAHLVLKERTLWPNMTHPSAAQLLLKTTEQHNTTIHVNSSITKINANNNTLSSLALSSNTEIATNCLIVAIGIDSKPKWLQNTGILGKKGILTDQYLQTTDPSIYSCGDCTEYPTITGHQTVGNWQNALAMGNAVAHNILGSRKPFRFLPKYQIDYHDWVIQFIGDTKPEHSDRFEDVSHKNSYVRRFYNKGLLVGLSYVGKTPPPKEFTSEIVY